MTEEIKVEVKPEVKAETKVTTPATPAPAPIKVEAPTTPKKPNGKTFDKKKINRFNKAETNKEISRLTNLGDTSSRYFNDLTKHLNTLP